MNALAWLWIYLSLEPTMNDFCPKQYEVYDFISQMNLGLAISYKKAGANLAKMLHVVLQS